MKPDASSRRPPRIGFVLLCALLFGLGAVHHLHVGRFDLRTSIYGHPGDGIFNLWVLEHVFQNAPRGLDALSDGRIFHPAENTYWWSDNSLAPALPYAAFRLAGASPIPAFVLTALFLSVLGFAAICLLFLELRRGMGAPAWTRWLVPFAACLAFFTQTRMRDAEHFQYLSSAFWILLLAAALRHTRERRPRDLAAMTGCMLLLMGSAPYFALLGVCLFLSWAWLLLADPRVDLRRWLPRTLPILLAFGLPVLAIAAAYASTDPVRTPLDTLRASSLRPERFLSPVFPASLPREAPGLPTLLACILCLAAFVASKRNALRHREIRIPLLAFGLSFADIKELRPFDAWLRAGLCLWAVVRVGAVCRKRGLGAWQAQMLFLAGVAGLVFGMAMGPGKDFGNPHFIPNAWGLFSVGLPGFRGMRHLIRFAAMAQLILQALAFAGALRLCQTRHARAWALVFALLAALHLIQHAPARTGLSRIDTSLLALQTDERAFFQTLAGSMLVVPAAPFHRNPEHMLRWIGCPDLRLLNGYSGRLPPTFAEIIRLENHKGRASPEQIAAAVAQGADYLCLPRAFVADATEEAVAAAHPVLFANGRFLVVDLRPARRNA
jgi:hypothetical protein